MKLFSFLPPSPECRTFSFSHICGICNLLNALGRCCTHRPPDGYSLSLRKPGWLKLDVYIDIHSCVWSAQSCLDGWRDISAILKFPCKFTVCQFASYVIEWLSLSCQRFWSEPKLNFDQRNQTINAVWVELIKIWMFPVLSIRHASSGVNIFC